MPVTTGAMASTASIMLVGRMRSAESSAFTAGVLSGQSATLTKSGTLVTITVADHAGSGKTGTSGTFTVNTAAAAQLVVTAVLLARFRAILVLLPLVAVPAAFVTRRAERTRRDGELASAGDRRAAQHLFNLTSSAASAKDIRIYGLRTELLGRHRHLSEEVHRRIESALFRSVLVNAGGWFLFAAAYVAAVIVVLAQAAHGRVTAGDVALTLTLATSLVAAAGRLSELAGSGLRAVTASEHYHWLDGICSSGRRAHCRTFSPCAGCYSDLSP